MAKSLLKLKARKLRGEGESIKTIAKILRVSPGSVSVWCRDIQLTEEQIKTLEKNYHDPFYGNRLKNIQLQKQKRLDKIRSLREEGILNIGNLSDRELFLTGVALYWAEGFKKDSQAGFANTDPAMAKFFLKWITQVCRFTLKDLSLRVTVNIDHKERIEEIQNYWSSILNVPTDQFQKPFYQNVKWKKVYENPNEYYGVIRIKVRRSTDFLRKVHGWIEGLRLA
jgi:hypothetical protein